MMPVPSEPTPEPTIADVLSAINGLRVAYREDLFAQVNLINRRLDRLQGDMEQRFGQLMDAIADHVQQGHPDLP